MTSRPVLCSTSLWLGVLLLGGLLLPSSGRAQSAPASETTPLAQALERLSADAQVSLVYESALVQGQTTRCPVEPAAPAATLNCLLDDTGLDFVQTSAGTYVVKPDVRRPPRTDTLRGVIWDRRENAPLRGVHVQLADGTTGTASDRDGHFQLPDLVAGRHTLVVSRLGYETKTVEATVRPGRPATRDTIALASTPVALAPVVVDASPSSVLDPSRRHDVVSPDQLTKTGPRGTPSVAHAAGTLMGITQTAPYADLHLQGGAAGDHEVRLDGVPVRNPTTAGRLLGAFSPLALDGLTAQKAGFGALRGDVLSGVVDLEHDLDRPDARHATLRVDPVSLNGRADGTVELGGTTVAAMGTARTSLWDVHRARSLTSLIDTWAVLDPTLTAAQLTADTSLADASFAGQRARPQSRFHDVHAAAEIEFAPGRRLDVSAYHGASRLGADLVVGTDGQVSNGQTGNFEGNRPITLPTSDRYEWTNTAAQVRYESTLSDRTTGALQASLSRYRAHSQYEVGELRGRPSSVRPRPRSPGSRADNAVTEVELDGTVDVSLPDRTRLSFSGRFTSFDTRVDLANAFVGPLQHETRRSRLTVAGEAEVGLGPSVTVEGGLRLTARPNAGGLFAEPRAALQYQPSASGLGDLALRVGGGLYRKFTTQFGLLRDGATAVVPSTQVWTPVPPDLEPPRTYHLASSLHWRPRSSWTVGAEGYVKWQPHLLAVDYPAAIDEPDLLSPSAVLSPSRGTAYGGGVHVSYEGAAGTSTLRYSYTQARRTFPGRFDGRRVPTPWTEPHHLSLETRVPLGDVLSADLRGTGIWGRSWGYRRSYYAYLRPEALDNDTNHRPEVDRPGDHVLPPLYRLDASLVAEHSWGDVSVTGRIGLLNVLGRANVADWGLRPGGDESVERWARTLPGRRSIVSLEIRY